MREELKAAGMHARQHLDRRAGIQAADDPRGEHEAKVDLVALECLRIPRTPTPGDVAHLGKPFCA
jgi:hypothetical protein